MMDTVLNLGLNDETVRGARQGCRSALRLGFLSPLHPDVRKRRARRRAPRVRGDPRDRAREARREPSTPRSMPKAGRRSSRSTSSWSRTRSETPFPQAPYDQLWGAIGAVFGSWMNARAIAYRQLHDIPASWGTAVNVQAMVFGNMGETSATGVAFTRNPSTGEKALYGEFLVNAQGEDVVAGIRTPQDLTEAARIASGSTLPSLETLMPEAFAEFRAHGRAAREPLPRHAGRRVHHRARQALDAADARRQAHREGGAEDRRRHGRGRADHARGGDRPHRAGLARPAPAPDARPERRAHADRARPAGLARRGDGRDRLHRRGGGASEGRGARR